MQLKQKILKITNIFQILSKIYNINLHIRDKFLNIIPFLAIEAYKFSYELIEELLREFNKKY